jgi:hypothetical protein
MIAVIFEVWPADGQRQTYLGIAAHLRPLLDEIDGFISIERFESLTEPGRSYRSPSGATSRRSRHGGSAIRIAARRFGDGLTYSRITA